MTILDRSVGHFMATKVDTIESCVSVFDAAAKFSKSTRRRYPVLEKGQLVGQISRKDIVVAAINMKSQTWRIK